MKLNAKYCMTSAILLMAMIPATEADTNTVIRPNGDTAWYYTIGGGDPYVYYRQSDKTSISLGVGVEWSLWKSCRFDPTFGITETFKDIKQNVYGLSNTVLNDATAVFTGWGLSKIQENWPGLYDTLSKGLKDAKETYQLSVKNCHDVQNDLKNHRNPADDWISISRESSWAHASQDGANPVTAQDSVETTAGDAGVQWVNGDYAGGKDQLPIHVVADTITAGYDHLVGDVVPNIVGGGIQVTGDASIARVFPDAESAAKWTTAVIGERDIRTCVDCTKLTTRVGQGLRKQFADERDKVDQTLLTAIQSAHPSTAQLDALSVPGMGVITTEQVIQSLQRAPYAEKMILANRLASEIALARQMEKALIARDLLNAGAQDSNIAANGPAQADISLQRAALQREIDNVLFETDVRKRVLNNAEGELSARGEARDHDVPNALQYIRPVHPEPSMTSGGVSK